jgi:hypothetical protein
MAMTHTYQERGPAYEATLARLSKDFLASGDFGQNRAQNFDGDDDDNLLSGCATDRLQAFTDEPTRRLGMAITVNGVSLSRSTAEQLRALGMPLEWYTAGELEDIELACSLDGNLIDDQFGDNLHDKLYLDADEKEARKHDSLHGFHKDEFEDHGHTRLQRRVKRKEQEIFVIPDCDKEHIFSGMRMLLSPAEVEEHHQVSSGLHSPHVKRETVKCAA